MRPSAALANGSTNSLRLLRSQLPQGGSLSARQSLPEGGVEQLQELAEAAQHNDEGVVQQLAKMIPTFTPTRQNLKL